MWLNWKFLKDRAVVIVLFKVVTLLYIGYDGAMSSSVASQQEGSVVDLQTEWGLCLVFSCSPNACVEFGFPHTVPRHAN